MTVCRASVRNVHLRIPVFAPNQLRLLRRTLVTAAVGGNIDETDGKVHVQALRGISFELGRGEHLALIGHNGSGKTSLLKVLAGIYPATLGEVEVHGTIGCLFDHGAGITPDMTGYECIRFQHLIHGRPDEDWKELIEPIADFTELGRYLELPVRTYSAGMQTRLTAALATAWRRDILLIDEGIGAGDQAFQDKLTRRINDLLESAGLLVIASHSTELLKRYCTRAAVLEHGETKMMGSLDEALRFYAQRGQ
jgi:ABC-type polysaccharide/polyol phosphate transport system ATPase subunit